MLGFKNRFKSATGGDAERDKGGATTRAGGMFARLRERLGRTRDSLTQGIASAFGRGRKIDAELLEDLETRLLLADVGVETTGRIIRDLESKVKRAELSDLDSLLRALRDAMLDILAPCTAPLQVNPAKAPFVVLVIGVNGAGKTTTIGKLASHWRADGYRVMLAAGDTFRAAAVEQLQAWGERVGVPVIAQHTGADSASVIFDALQAGKARGTEVLVADTAGRLHTQGNLMQELAKVKRVLAKLDPDAPHETLLVLDASTGQNALSQARHFHQSVGVTGLVLTKLDGTAKGGVVFAIADALRLPIRFIGVGESAEDLRPFDAEEFVQALIGDSGREGTS